MTAQKKDVKTNPEQRQSHADNNGWIEVKTNKRETTKNPSPKSEKKGKKNLDTKNNQFDSIKEITSEKLSKQRATTKVPQTKTKNIQKEKTESPKKVKSVETPKAKKIETKSTPKAKPAQVPVKNEKLAKVVKPAKASSAKTSKATAKDVKKTDVTKRKGVSMVDYFKKIVYWLGVSLLVAGVFSIIACGYKQHRNILDDTIAQHSLKINEMQAYFDTATVDFNNKLANNQKLVDQFQNEINVLRSATPDMEAQEQFNTKLQWLEQKYVGQVQTLMVAKQKGEACERELSQLKAEMME